MAIASCGARGGAGARRPSETSDGNPPAVLAFPSEAEVQHLVATMPPPPLAVDDSVRPAHWALGPAVLDESGVADVIALRVAEGRDATTSVGARCTARELARFVAAHGGVPDASTRGDMAAICGMPTTGVALAARQFGGVSASDAALVEEVAAGLAADLVTGLGGSTEPVDVGAAMYRVGNAGAIAAVAGLSAVRLDGAHPAPSADGTVTFTGTRITAGSLLVALANVGASRAEECDVTANGVRFSVTCPSDPGDALSRIDLVAAEHDGILLMPVGSVFAVRDPGATLEVGTGDAVAAPASAETFATTVAPLLDARRSAAGLAPLVHAPLQSAANRELVPFIVGGERADRELASLAAVAGYSVDGLIREGRMTVAVELGTNDAARWLDRALAIPTGRWVLLGPEARTVALGAYADGASLAGLVTTYAFFESTPEDDAMRVMAVLTDARAARGLAPAIRAVSIPGMDEALGRLARGERSPAGALDDVLRAISASSRSARGWAGATSDLAITPMPDDLTTPPDAPRVGVGVAPYRAPGGAWGQYGVLMVQIVE